MILFLVLFLLITTLKYFTYSDNSPKNRHILAEAVNFFDFKWLRLVHGTSIEIIWTIIPSIILVLIAIPSFALLYATDELVDPSVTVQVIGHQWYWSYEYNVVATTTSSTSYQKSFDKIAAELVAKYDLGNIYLDDFGAPRKSTVVSIYNIDIFKRPWFVLAWYLKPKYLWIVDSAIGKNLVYPNYTPASSFEETTPLSTTFQFDSYMKQESDLNLGELRLYETDFPLILPKLTHIRFLITADDVIHSWSVPALGIKVDAVPGRINQAHTFIKRSGIFYGQCSELCGVNHAFMPIQIIAFEPHMYYDYLRFLFLNK